MTQRESAPAFAGVLARPTSRFRLGPGRTSPRPALAAVGAGLLVLIGLHVLAGVALRAQTDAVRKAAPPLVLPDLGGEEFSLVKEKGKPIVICFGELYNRNTLDALDELSAMCHRTPLSDSHARFVLVVGSRDPSEEIRKEWMALGKDSEVTILHDRTRKVFEAYGVKVLPTFSIVDPEGRLVVSMSGYPLNFADVITDGILTSIGKLDPGRLKRALQPSGAHDLDENRIHALRTARMAAALAKRELYPMAEERFDEALTLDPTLLEARIGLARVKLAQSRVQEAEALFQQVLKRSETNLEAHIGLARIEVKRDQLDQARKRLETQIALHPLQPELHYLLGTAFEKGGEKEKALGAYKKAAQLLLERYGK